MNCTYCFLIFRFFLPLQPLANVGIEGLNRSLLNIQERLRSKGKKLPPVFYLQADNCAKDNKNKYMLAYLAHLVVIGVFRKIRLSFLLVGHTWTDVDETFGWVFGSIRKGMGVTTLDEYRQRVHEAYFNAQVPLDSLFMHLYIYVCIITIFGGHQ